MVLLAYWGGLLWRLQVHMRMRGSSENGVTQLPSLGYRNSVLPISSRAPVLHLWLPSTPHFHTVHDQARGSTSLLSFISDVAVFPGPPLLRDCGFDPFCPSAKGVTKKCPGASRTQEHLQDCAAADAQRLPARPRKSS